MGGVEKDLLAVVASETKKRGRETATSGGGGGGGGEGSGSGGGGGGSGEGGGEGTCAVKLKANAVCPFKPASPAALVAHMLAVHASTTKKFTGSAG